MLIIKYLFLIIYKIIEIYIIIKIRIFANVKIIVLLTAMMERNSNSFSKKIPINSEFRIFVLNGEIVGIKRYLSDINSKVDTKYCEKIEKIYSKYNKAFILDIAVSIENKTEKIFATELHDFFSCELYGWDNYINIRKMTIVSNRQILGINPKK